ncbi:MAG: hypothetical protein WDA07_05140 [Leucobacter sp.]
MSEHDEQRPMTRRERRLRELAETGAMDLSEALQPPRAQDAETPASVPGADESELAQPSGDDIEISPFNDDGTPRSRREIRQLREAALAARADSLQAETIPSAPRAGVEAEQSDSGAEPEPDPGTGESVVPPAVEEVVASGEESLDFDTLMTPPTEPFSVEELREAEQSAATEFEEPVPFGEAADDSAAPVEASGEPAQGKPKRRFPWTRKSAETPGAASEVNLEDAESSDVDAVVQPDPTIPETNADADAAGRAPDEPASPVDGVESADTRVVPTETDVIDADSLEEVLVEPVEEAAVVVEEVELDVEPVPAPRTPDTEDEPGSAKYSFPDIQPPEEWRSVFDDPTARTVPEQGEGGQGDFDDLISRAVAQEGSTAGSSTSALILPTMPEDTGGLSGPLGATGELYLTGSIELPKSLGETGGHSTLHDSLQMEPVSAPISDEPLPETHEGPQPVAAKHAVSARASSGMSVVAKPAKERSKLPLVLTITGGGLLIVVVAIGIWGVSTGMFSG